jgi:hypothetical protein
MNKNRQRAILAAQKVKQQATPKPLPDDFKLPPLTAEQRREIYAPRHATNTPQHLPAKPKRIVKAAKTTAKATGLFFGVVAFVCGGIILGETKTGLRA